MLTFSKRGITPRMDPSTTSGMLYSETKCAAPMRSRCRFPRWAIGSLPLASPSWGSTPQRVTNCSLASPTLKLLETSPKLGHCSYLAQAAEGSLPVFRHAPQARHGGLPTATGFCLDATASH